MKDYNLLVFVLSMAINLLIILASKKYNFFMDPLNHVKVQSFHKNLTPRAGGISIYMLSLLFSYFTSNTMFMVVLAFLPAFIYGVYEDIDGNTPQKVRLLVMSFSTLLATLMTGITIKSIGFINIPEIAQIPFTVFAVIGLASAINFIDGLNGLASGVTTITFSVFGLAAYAVGNNWLGSTMFLSASIMLGFFALNFPFGKIFLGDAGAYYLGYMVAMSSEALVMDNSQISPWFPVAVLSYPIIETLFTMWRRYRRLKKRGVKFFTAEKVHLHSLLYLRVLKSNPAASMSIFTFFGINSFLAFSLKSSGPACACLFAANCLVYLLFYRNIVNFSLGKLFINTSKIFKRDAIEEIKIPALNKEVKLLKEEKVLVAVSDIADEV